MAKDKSGPNTVLGGKGLNETRRHFSLIPIWYTHELPSCVAQRIP